MNLIDNNGSIRYLNFICLDTNTKYEILGTSSTYKGIGKDNHTMSTSKLKRADDIVRHLTQPQLKQRFINIKEI